MKELLRDTKGFAFIRAGIVSTLLVLPLLASAGQPSLNRLDEVVTVTFSFPDGKRRADKLTYFKAQRILKEHSSYKLTAPTPYKIDFWIYAALLDLGIGYRIEVAADDHSLRRSIVEIDSIKNDAAGHWVYYVNNIKSKYHINTQSDEGLKDIRFVFEKYQSNAAIKRVSIAIVSKTDLLNH